jgi:hypothetical protein
MIMIMTIITVQMIITEKVVMTGDIMMGGMEVITRIYTMGVSIVLENTIRDS